MFKNFMLHVLRKLNSDVAYLQEFFSYFENLQGNT